MASARKAILVVEDDPPLRAMFLTALKFAGFDVRQAGDGFEALNIIEQYPPDLVVLDLGLPRLDGLAVHAEISAQAITRNIAVVIVTGEDRDLTSVKAACILRKPVNAERLVTTVTRCLASGTEAVSSS
jgi:DNA-binding response OmpR family regulator